MKLNFTSDRDDLDQLMTEKRVGIYVGVDPTAASMHIGHLLPLMVVYWAYIKGFHACSLVGCLYLICHHENADNHSLVALLRK